MRLGVADRPTEFRADRTLFTSRKASYASFGPNSAGLKSVVRHSGARFSLLGSPKIAKSVLVDARLKRAWAHRISPPPEFVRRPEQIVRPIGVDSARSQIRSPEFYSPQRRPRQSNNFEMTFSGCPSQLWIVPPNFRSVGRRSTLRKNYLPVVPPIRQNISPAFNSACLHPRTSK